MPEDSPQHHGQRNHDHWNAERMSQPIQRMLMALCVARDPTVPTPVSQHVTQDTPLQVVLPKLSRSTLWATALFPRSPRRRFCGQSGMARCLHDAKE